MFVSFAAFATWANYRCTFWDIDNNVHFSLCENSAVFISFAIASCMFSYCQYFIRPFPSSSDRMVTAHGLATTNVVLLGCAPGKKMECAQSLCVRRGKEYSLLLVGTLYTVLNYRTIPLHPLRAALSCTVPENTQRWTSSWVAKNGILRILLTRRTIAARKGVTLQFETP
jgi:hypothetical protein